MNISKNNKCKICGTILEEIIDHTAKCKNCGVLLYYPYPTDEDILDAFMSENVGYEWYANSFERKITGFIDIIMFILDDKKQQSLNVLDYGGASGQFALIFKSFFPKSKVFITDINDNSLFKEYVPLNEQIKFNEFDKDKNTFDLIFLNDVYEHVEDPITLIQILEKKLNPDGRIFIDTPRQFWIYPFFKKLSKYVYKKILKGTVSKAHLQIWTDKSFDKSIENTDLFIVKKQYYTELTQNPEYYLRSMKINNVVLRKIILIFVSFFLFTFRNKILAVLKKKNN